MKKLLVTGFDPFGGQPVNPAREAVLRLPDTVGGYEITKLEIPTVFGLAAETVLQAAEELRPHAILCVGQAGGRSAVTPEVVAINLREATIPDNAGNVPVNTSVIENAPAAYFASLPVRDMVQAVKERGIPCALSYTAGTFVCNDLLYTLLHHYRDSDVRVGFVHIPYLPEQAGEGVPSMELSTVVEALTAMIGAMD
ncbi:MAG: pyroglutamyl-peptidase I [Ruminococcaceae bacterium]|nr:pyroglutamyl-peptidase I [Oscillospiraceae bacterium]